MRLFVAFELPESVRRAIEGWASPLHTAGSALPSLPFRIAEGALFASQLQPSGAVHTKVATFRLRGGA